MDRPLRQTDQLQPHHRRRGQPLAGRQRGRRGKHRQADLPAAGTYTISIPASHSDNINAGAISVWGAAQQGSEATAFNQITVSDDQDETPIFEPDSDDGDDHILAPGESRRYEVSEVVSNRSSGWSESAKLTTYHNVGTVKGWYAGSLISN